MTQFFDNSPQALEKRVGKLPGVAKYPWKDVPSGKSFAVPRDDIKFNVLRSLASKTGKKLGRKFRVIDHGEGQPYEVACLAHTQAEAIATSSNVVEALGKVKKGEL